MTGQGISCHFFVRRCAPQRVNCW